MEENNIGKITNLDSSLPIRIEEIEAREYGNPLIARGAFGEVKIAIQLPTNSIITAGESANSSNNNDNINNNKNDDYDLRMLMYPPKPRFLALKTIRNAVVQNHEKSSYEFTPAVFTELASLRALTPNENIVPLLCTKYQSSSSSKSVKDDFFSSIHSNSLSFVFPYCPSDLQEIISYRRRCNQHFTLPMIWYIMNDICNGLEHCHSKGIIHCDIKPGNIVLSTKGTFQLADFGIARLDMKLVQEMKKKNKELESNDDQNEEGTNNVKRQRRNQLDHHGLCTLYYRPPELLYGSTTYEPSLDMWGVGLILAELATLRPLFPGCNVIDQLSRIMDVMGTPTKETWPSINELPDYNKIQFDTRSGSGLRIVVARIANDNELMNLLEQLVVMDPIKRFSASKCLNHTWLSPQSKIGMSPFNDIEVMAQLMLQSCIFNKEVLGDDGMFYGSSMSKFDGIHEEIVLDDDELLEQMKLKGVAMAEARRNLSTFGNAP